MNAPSDADLVRSDHLWPSPETVKSVRRSNAGPWGFSIFVLYIVFEYARPQSALPAIAPLRIPGIITAALAVMLPFSGGLRLTDLQTRLFLALLALMALHVPLAVNNFWAFMLLRSMAMTLVVYLAAIAYVDSYDRLRKLVTIWLAIHVYLAVWGIANKGRGVAGFLDDENDFCMTMNMVIPFALVPILSERQRTRRVLYVAVAGLFLVAIVTSLSRGGFVGLAAVGLFWLLRSSKRVRAVTAVGVLAALAVAFAPDRYWDEVRSIREGTQDRTGEERVYEWKIGGLMFRDNPIFGVGQGNFPYRFREYEAQAGFREGLHGRSRAGRAAHSLYFTLLPELGIMGALLYLAMVRRTFADLRDVRQVTGRLMDRPGAEPARRMHDLAAALTLSLVAFLVSGAFISILYYPNAWIVMGFTVALRRTALELYEDGPTSD